MRSSRSPLVPHLQADLGRAPVQLYSQPAVQPQARLRAKHLRQEDYGLLPVRRRCRRSGRQHNSFSACQEQQEDPPVSRAGLYRAQVPRLAAAALVCKRSIRLSCISSAGQICMFELFQTGCMSSGRMDAHALGTGRARARASAIEFDLEPEAEADAHTTARRRERQLAPQAPHLLCSGCGAVDVRHQLWQCQQFRFRNLKDHRTNAEPVWKVGSFPLSKHRWAIALEPVRQCGSEPLFEAINRSMSDAIQ